MSNISALSFNVEYLDETLDSYHLGNGYRAYNPTIMQFTAPDDMSPFGHGGINPYMYCAGDPINNTDPTGHFLGLAFSLAGAIALFNMVSPIQAPTTASLPGVEGAVINTGMNIVAEAVMPGAGGEVAIAAEHSAEAAIITTSEHGIERETEALAKQRVQEASNISREKIHLKEHFRKQRSISPESVYELQRSRSGRFLLRNPNGETKVPEDDVYFYVIRTDRDVINVAERTKYRPITSDEITTHRKNGHTSLTRLGGTGDSTSDYQSIYYAGEIEFNENPRDPPFWNNNSGHYLPPAELRHTNLTVQQRELLLPDKWSPKI